MHPILVVDDEPQIRELLNRWLTDEGYDVREADSAERALALMAERCAAVVMCDIEMPGQGGVWLAEQLRERYPASAMILATGLDSIPPATSFKSGIVAYLVKPFQRAGMVKAVAAAIAWHSTAAGRRRAPEPSPGAMSSWLDSSLDGSKDEPGT